MRGLFALLLGVGLGSPLRKRASVFRFIHSSDLHLGKPFGQIPDDHVRGRLVEARFQKIDVLLDLAEQKGASHILLAGDTFDAETPSPATRRQAVGAMGRDQGIKWVILPGNHDSLAADELWRNLSDEAPKNVILALKPEPIELATGVTLLPAPCPARRAGRDLSAWMDDAATPEGHLRIGLAHGGVRSFSEDGAADVLSPDRASCARLDYLALGDWHGQVRVDPHTWYSGAPEADQFKHAKQASALSVTIDGAGQQPQVDAVETGQFHWIADTLNLTPGADPVAQLNDLLPPDVERRNALMHIALSGRIKPADRAALMTGLSDAEPDFARLVWRERDLVVEYEVDDLDRIDQAGVLRSAAATLYGQANDPESSAEDRTIARNALNRLYSYAVELT